MIHSKHCSIAIVDCSFPCADVMLVMDWKWTICFRMHPLPFGRLATNYCHYQASNRRHLYGKLHAMQSLTADGYDSTAEDKPLINELHEQIALLDEPDRTIVRMQLEGYRYEEIGKAVDMTEKNVSVRLIRIKEKLRKKMIL